MKTVQERFESKFSKTDGCWEWTGCKDRCGYGQIKIAGRMHSAHRTAYQLYVGIIPDGLCVCHQCDNPSCVRPDHLFLGTNADNMQDCITKGRFKYLVRNQAGESNKSAKLTIAQVQTIRAMYKQGVSQRKLAREFGVAQSNISMIVCYQTWRELQPE